jgi:RNA polymerase sigma-70 factor (ECF subfamily)
MAIPYRRSGAVAGHLIRDGGEDVHMPNRQSAEQMDPEASLAGRIAAGDSEAWARFFDHYFTWAYQFAHRHLDGNPGDAEDLCSDILLSAAQSMHSFDPRRGSLEFWLLGLARRRLARFCRRSRRHEPMVPRVAESGTAHTDAMLTRDLVNRALASLPRRQALALVGKYVTGHSTEELAGVLGSSPKGAESLLARGRAAFREAFAALVDSASAGDSNG